MLRGVFAAYFTLLHIAGHKRIDKQEGHDGPESLT
jgi:hypothetical protein